MSDRNNKITEPIIHNPPADPEQPAPLLLSPHAKMKKIWRSAITAILGICCVGMAVFTIYTYESSLRSAREDAIQSFHTERESKKREMKERLYQNSYEIAKAHALQENHVEINIKDIQDIAELAVLEVRDTEFIIVSEEDSPSKVTFWLKAVGTSTFSVNLRSSEILTNANRGYVLVRVPKPHASPAKLEYDKVDILLAIDDGKQESQDDLNNFLDQQLVEAQKKIGTAISGNQQYNVAAQETAEWMIKKIVKGFNPDFPNLIVDVEFLD